MLNYFQITFKIRAALLAYLFLVLSLVLICQINSDFGIEVEETSFEMKVAYSFF